MTPANHRRLATTTISLFVLTLLYWFAFVSIDQRDYTMLYWLVKWLEEMGVSEFRALLIGSLTMAALLCAGALSMWCLFSWYVPWVCPGCGLVTLGSATGSRVYRCKNCSRPPPAALGGSGDEADDVDATAIRAWKET